MGLNAVIDVAVGIVLMYMVLSLLATVINEFIAMGFNLRSKSLRRGIRFILDDTGLRDRFYKDGLIAAANSAASGRHVSYLPGQTFALAVVSSLDPSKQIPTYEDIKFAAETMPASRIKDVLLSELAVTDRNLDHVVRRIANYYDTAMDQVSETYKKKLKIISLVVGLAIAGALNADSLGLGTALWRDTSIRAEIVAVLTPTEKGNADTLTVDQQVKRLHQMETELRPIPIGWAPGTTPHTPFDWLVKIFGLIITGLALSFGAPFWFDLLSKVMNIRDTGPKPAKVDAA